MDGNGSSDDDGEYLQIAESAKLDNQNRLKELNINIIQPGKC